MNYVSPAEGRSRARPGGPQPLLWKRLRVRLFWGGHLSEAERYPGEPEPGLGQHQHVQQPRKHHRGRRRRPRWCPANDAPGTPIQSEKVWLENHLWNFARYLPHLGGPLNRNGISSNFASLEVNPKFSHRMWDPGVLASPHEAAVLFVGQLVGVLPVLPLLHLVLRLCDSADPDDPVPLQHSWIVND